MFKNPLLSRHPRLAAWLRPRTLGAAVLAASAATLAAAPAHAVPQLKFVEGASSFTVVDQDSNDAAGGPGTIAYVGTFGSFSFNVSGAITKPALGSATAPEMDLSSLNVSGISGGTLQLLFTETDYLGDGSAVSLISGIGGATNGTVNLKTYASTSNTAFATDTLLADSGTLTGSTFQFDTQSSLSLSGLYSLTTVVTITHATEGLNSSVNAIIEVPEPALAPSLVVGGLMLAGAAVRRRRKAA